jgi:hypothetical protein
MLQAVDDPDQQQHGETRTDADECGRSSEPGERAESTASGAEGPGERCHPLTVTDPCVAPVAR